MNIRTDLKKYQEYERSIQVNTLTLFLKAQDRHVVVKLEPKNVYALHVTEGIISESLSYHLMECKPSIVDFYSCTTVFQGFQYISSIVSKAETVSARNILDKQMLESIVNGIKNIQFKGNFKASDVKFFSKTTFCSPLVQDRLSKLELYKIPLTENQYFVLLKSLNSSINLKNLALQIISLDTSYPFVKGTETHTCRLSFKQESSLTKDILRLNTSQLRSVHINLTLKISLESVKQIVAKRSILFSSQTGGYHTTVKGFTYYNTNPCLDVFCGTRSNKGTGSVDGALVF